MMFNCLSLNCLIVVEAHALRHCERSEAIQRFRAQNNRQKYRFFGNAPTFFAIFAMALIIFLFLSVN